MYPVSQDFQEKIKKRSGTFETKIQIQHSKGVLDITDKELAQGTLIYTESSQAGEEFTIGSTVASDISFTILNKEEYKDINFMRATVFCNIGLLVKEGADAHFLQPSQPSKMPRFDEKWEYVPLGRFNIDYVNIQRNSIELKAIDNMINLDKPYSLSKLSYPATLYQIYVNACNVCDVLPGTTSFSNMHYVVKNRPDGDLTFRDVLGYVAELAGCFAKTNRNGAITLEWYKPSGITLGPANRFDFKASDDLVQIKGIMATVEDTTYLAGSEDYAIDLSENPLLQGGYETVLPNVFNNVKNTVFTPYTSNWQGNPAIQAGDIITQIDRDGKEYNTLVTKSIYKYRGRSTLEAKGLPEISKGYKGSTNRKIAQIKRAVEKEVGDKLTNLEQAQLNATELMANMLGGYKTTIKYESDPDYARFGMGEFIHDSPQLSDSTKIWKWGPGGFGHSSDGGLTWPTAITADGSIVAMLVAANIVTANMVQTGILTSEDGNSWFNLDNGILRISHGGNVYSQADINGFGKNYGNGMVSYLNDIFVHYENSSNELKPSPSTTRVYLPTRFRNRNISVSLGAGNTYWRVGNLRTGGAVSRLVNWIETIYEVNTVNTNTTTPYIDINSYIHYVEYYDDGTSLDRYILSGFVLIVIGE
ncbi:hypothetical protein CIW83_18460 [Tissierella sp. P1]|uniref:hypothetical protein n=1 Tax=Tissierella sp. P1 TaxID=1280483 RepID=UPI000BA0DCA9|nr:hypothetical protein [Tissierella sp. P1]OZV10801.1 hypothetical protein CIW83_18460 [Tissierella sp. P1]